MNNQRNLVIFFIGILVVSALVVGVFTYIAQKKQTGPPIPGIAPQYQCKQNSDCSADPNRPGKPICMYGACAIVPE